jgi:3-oxoacyl-[acyl-carrier-protein] synthase II
MSANSLSITGIGSVTPYGPLAGVIPTRSLQPSTITAWTTAGLRRAFLVEPFRPASVVPGLNTRRLDRLSAWALVASSLAIQDAGIDLSKMDRTKIAVVFATGFGCVELTGEFYRSAAANGWSGTDPITFPETLTNAPAAHVALFHGLRGANITVDSKSFAAESALIQAASLIRHGQAELAIVLAGDTLTQAVYGWYEAADLLSSACYNSEALPEVTGIAPSAGFVPSEGVAALVLEPAGSREARSYAYMRSGCWAEGGEPVKTIRQMLGGSALNIILCGESGAPCAVSPLTGLAHEIAGPDAAILPPQAVAAGLAESGGLLHLILALSSRAGSGQALLLATSGKSGFAAIHLELP